MTTGGKIETARSSAVADPLKAGMSNSSLRLENGESGVIA